MTRARSEVVRAGEIGVYHCIHRCVRRAFLCGNDPLTGRCFDHRRGWIRNRLKLLADAFAIDVGGYAVMGNHLHLVLRTRPDLAASFSPDELAARWWRIFPKRRNRRGAPCDPTPDDLKAVLDDRGGGEQRIAELRERLGSLSWFMRCLAEPIARRANKEDGCTGRFWEGRFKAQALLDEAAILACGIYVDLNPIRAGMAVSPETSRFTSVRDRIRGRQGREKLAALAATNVDPRSLGERRLAELRHEAETDAWLCPIGGQGGLLPDMDLDTYLELVDWTGRQIVSGKRGHVPHDLAPVLDRLQVEVSRWMDTVTGFGRMFFLAAGTVEAMYAEARRVARRWLRGVGAAKLAFRTA